MRILWVVIGFLLCFAIVAYPATPSFDCVPASQIVSLYLGEGTRLVGTAITDDAAVIQLFINPDTRHWAIVGIDGEEKDRACLIVSGFSWRQPGEATF